MIVSSDAGDVEDVSVCPDAEGGDVVLGFTVGLAGGDERLNVGLAVDGVMGEVVVDVAGTIVGVGGGLFVVGLGVELVAAGVGAGT